MRPLRQWIAGAEPPMEIGPVEPLAVLAVVARPEPAFDPEQVFDRSLFGLGPAEVRALGPVAPHLCEVAWEALEASGIPLVGLSERRLGTWVGAPGMPPWSGREAAIVCEVLGLAGPAVQVVEAGANGLLALHLGAAAIRADDVDIAIVLGGNGTGGVGAAVLARVEQATPGQWRVRSLLLGSAVSRPGAGLPARRSAEQRSGLERAKVVVHDRAELATVAEVVRGHEGGEARSALVESSGETVSVAAMFAAPEQTSSVDSEYLFLGITARSPAALRALARGAADRLRTDFDLLGLASDGHARPAFEHRLAIPAPVGASGVRARLRGWLAGEPDGVAVGRVGSGHVAFVVPPAGAQLLNVADQLYGADEVFREALNRCDRVLRSHMPRPLLSALYPAPGRELPVDDPVFANPLTVALAWSLAEMLRARGVIPHAVLGCGVGELAAGVIAGAIDLEAALRLSADRGRLLHTIDDECSRVVVGATEEQILELIAANDGVDVVAVPMPGRVVIGGVPGEIEQVLERVRAHPLRYERMTGHPAHTPLVDRVLGEHEELAVTLEPLDPSTWSAAWVSAATGRRVESAPDPYFWGTTLRAPMRFAAGAEALYAEGCRYFVELASRPTMTSAGAATLAQRPVGWLSPLAPDHPDLEQLADVLGRLWVHGVPVERGPLTRPPGTAELPTYPWDRRPLDQEIGHVESEDEVPPPTAPLRTDRSWLPELPSDHAVDGLAPAPDEGSAASPPPGDQDALDAPVRDASGDAGDFDDDLEELDDAAIGELSIDDLPPAPPPVETVERAPTDGLLEDEDLGIEAHQGRPVSLQEAEQQADVHATWSESWEPYPLPAEPLCTEPATWVVLADAEGVGDYISALLVQRGHHCVRVLHEPPYPRDDGTLFVSDPSADGAWDEVVEALGALHGAVRVLHLWTLDLLDDEGADPLVGWASVLKLVKVLHDRGLPVRLQLVTRGAAYRPDAATAHHAGALWGAGRLVAVELPEVFGGLIDLDPDDEDPDELLDHLLAEAPNGPGTEVAFRGDQRLKRVVTRTEGLPDEGTIDTDGAWLFGGDVDQSALELAAWFAARGVKRLVLVCSEAPPPDVLRGVLDLQRDGVMCNVVRADVSKGEDRERLDQRLRGMTLAGVVLRDSATAATLAELDPGQAAARWAHEIAVAIALEALAGDVPLWVWSEGRAMWPAPGSGVAAVTGAALDSAARARIAGGRPTTVIHAAPASSLSLGQAVRLVGQLGPLGGIHGIWDG